MKLIQHAENKAKPGNPAWIPGQSGNPKGRPVGSRQKIGEHVLSAYESVLGEDSVASLRQLKADDPGKFWSIAASLLPKEVAVSVQQAIPGNLSPDEWQTLRSLLNLIQAHAPADIAPAQIFGFIEHALRAEFAKPVIPAPPY